MCSVKERGLIERRAVYLLLILWPLLAFVSSGYSQTENRGRIAFYSTRDGHHEIYVMDIDGSNLKRLTFGNANNLCPAWSPDGQRIVLISDRDGNEEIYVMNADGSNQVRLTSTLFPEHQPSWSPDGTRIVFKAHCPENKDIYVMNADGGNLQRLTENPDLDATPDWSPDGRHIAFHSDRDGNREIYVMNADGSNPQRLTDNPALEVFPRWSPDGKQILFLSHREGAKDIYVMKADGSDVKRLTTQEGVDEGGWWSPDGKQIVFQTNRDGNYEIYIMNADGSKQRRLANHPADEYWPSWGPAIVAGSSAGWSEILLPDSAAVLASHDSIEFSSYAKMRERVGDLYSQQRYEEAAEILEGHLDKFPEKLAANAFNLGFFRLCMGQHEKCFDILDYALDRGLWFSSYYFLDSETWAPVKDMERYGEIKARNESLRQLAQAAAKPELLVITPKRYTGELKYPLFIALHGGDGNMNEFKEVWKSDLMNEQFIVAFIQSSQVISMTGFIWDDHAIARKEVKDAFEKVVEQYSVDKEQVIIGGFSNGGMASLDVTFSNTIPVIGFVVLCTGIPDSVLTAENVRSAKARGIRGTIITTKMEPDQRINAQRDLVELFRMEGLQYRFMVAPDIGHIIPDDIDTRIDLAIEYIRNR